MPKIRIQVEDGNGTILNWDIFPFATGREAAAAFLDVVEILRLRKEAETIARCMERQAEEDKR